MNCICLILNTLLAQTQFVTAVGGAGSDYAYALVQTPDGGYAIAGNTDSFGAGSSDVFLARFDSAGALQWAQTLGGTGEDYASSLVATADGGYILAGYTDSYGAGYYDALLAKFDSTGALQWARTLGGVGNDQAYSVVVTVVGDYALAGWTDSYGAGASDALLAVFNTSGTLQWARTLGGANYDPAYSLVTTPDGGYALAGRTGSFGAGGNDVLLARFDGAGTLQWTRALGGTGWDEAGSLVTTPDGGYALAGWTGSFGAGGNDILLARFDGAGALQWTRTLGGASNDYAYSLVTTPDSGYAVAAETYSFGAGLADVLLTRLDGAGALRWAHTTGGTSEESPFSLVATTDGGFASAGRTYTFGSGSWRALLIKLDSAGASCKGDTAAPTVTTPSPTVTSPSPTVTSPTPTVTSPSPTVTSPTLGDTMVCYFVAVTERNQAGEAARLCLRNIHGGLFINAAFPTGVSIYTVDGRMIKSLYVERETKVALKPGVYFVKPEGGKALKAAVR